ncbi:hypothetical protein GCM10025779_12530 [Arthrobacter cryoconiti]
MKLQLATRIRRVIGFQPPNPKVEVDGGYQTYGTETELQDTAEFEGFMAFLHPKRSDTNTGDHKPNRSVPTRGQSFGSKRLALRSSHA